MIYIIYFIIYNIYVKAHICVRIIYVHIYVKSISYVITFNFLHRSDHKSFINTCCLI